MRAVVNERHKYGIASVDQVSRSRAEPFRESRSSQPA